MTKYYSDEERQLSKIYANMKCRCYNPKTNGYKYYGGKGVCVCQEWLDDILSFMRWSFESGYKKGLSIDRKNADMDYSPMNCQWIPRTKNCGKTQKKPATNRAIVYHETPIYDIFRIRTEFNLSQIEFAQKIGVCQSSVSQWESGKTTPPKRMTRLIDLLVKTGKL